MCKEQPINTAPKDKSSILIKYQTPIMDTVWLESVYNTYYEKFEPYVNRSSADKYIAIAWANIPTKE